jgi:hypothetical protein
MKRKDFIKKAGLTAAGALVMPYILPSGRLFASSGARRANHVVFCLFAGGVRNIESMYKADGNLMTYTLTGNESISTDIIGGMDALPAPTGARLQTFGTLFKEFRYSNGPTGHYNGHTTALTGRYSDAAIKLKEPPQYPTIFEYYRKHNTPLNSALNAWWIADSLGPYPYLNYSLYDGYGPMYGANALQAASIFSPDANTLLGNPVQFSSNELAKCDMMKQFMNGQFTPPSEIVSTGIKNTPQDAAILQDFLRTYMSEVAAGIHNNPWGVPMNGDMFNIYSGIQIMKQFKPELMVVNMQGVDVCHANFTEYANNMRKADFALYKLWEAIQSTPGMANDTVLIVAPEHGRNLDTNTVLDTYGRYAIDHNNDEMSRRIFCLVAGPAGVVKQNQVINNIEGQSVDIVPTIANILGFDTDIPAGLLEGAPLLQAFV